MECTLQKVLFGWKVTFSANGCHLGSWTLLFWNGSWATLWNGTFTAIVKNRWWKAAFRKDGFVLPDTFSPIFKESASLRSRLLVLILLNRWWSRLTAVLAITGYGNETAVAVKSRYKRSFLPSTPLTFSKFSPKLFSGYPIIISNIVTTCCRPGF